MAAPLVSAEPAAPAADIPTVSVVASIPVMRHAGGSSASLVNGAVVFTAAGTAATTGSIHLEFTFDGPFEPEFDEEEFAAAGWTRVVSSDGTVFRGAPMADGQSRRVPRFRWRGPLAAKGRLAATVRSENTDVAEAGVTVHVR